MAACRFESPVRQLPLIPGRRLTGSINLDEACFFFAVRRLPSRRAGAVGVRVPAAMTPETTKKLVVMIVYFGAHPPWLPITLH